MIHLKRLITGALVITVGLSMPWGWAYLLTVYGIWVLWVVIGLPLAYIAGGITLDLYNEVRSH